MSLYRYLPGKAELVALMVERAIGEPPELRASGWREALAEWSELLYEAFLRHPWTMGGPPSGAGRSARASSAGWSARWPGSAATAGSPAPSASTPSRCWLSHARMLAQQADARMNEAEMTAAMGEVMRQHGDRFPYLTAAMTETATGGGQNLAFAFGLDRILDGLESLIDRRTGRV
nr:hypothetical protein GCM10020092_027280 [Actinoplanes digitatis]